MKTTFLTAFTRSSTPRNPMLVIRHPDPTLSTGIGSLYPKDSAAKVAQILSYRNVAQQ
jgi:hypothetical protein